MKLKKEFIVHESGGSYMLVPTGQGTFSGMVRGNKTFGAILSLLNDETDEETIVAEMSRMFDAPVDVIAQDVAKALDTLREIGAIDG
ncbi:MAG: PqqD family protein [Lachnospiraceae bacterium]|nr:PqqD family protein [Lachnospiraceae bacterium]